MSFIVDAIGTIGALMFAASCGPLAWKTWSKGSGLGTPRSSIWSFCAATVLFTLYLALKVGVFQGSTLISGFEAVAWLVILYYEYFPRWDTPDFGLCIRPHHEEGPCNGYPRRDCPMTPECREKFYPSGDVCQHLPFEKIDDATLTYRRMSD